MLGCDFAGTVEQTASNVSKIKKGDKIAALVWGGKTRQPHPHFNGMLMGKCRRDQTPWSLQVRYC